MRTKEIIMKNCVWTVLCLVLVVGFVGAGCDGGDDETLGTPAVDVNGKWDVRMDGTALGVMTFDVKKNGALSGWLHTLQDVTGRLQGGMDGYVADFTVQFANGLYWSSVLFNADATSGSGTLVDDKGFQRLLQLTPQATVAAGQ